jgi:hypothetical protein
MSDMSSLSHNYASTTDFSHHVKQAVLILKKLHFGSGRGVAEENSVKASALVAGMVRRLLQRMGAEVGKGTSQEAVVIPEDVLTRMEEKQRGNLEYFKDDLVKLNETLSRGGDLSAAEIDLLDSICDVADASASATFRKLWRR